MRTLRLSILGGLCVLLVAPFPAASETREAYLTRLRDICEVECMQPRELLRAARKRRKSSDADMAGILDVAYVSRFGDKYRLHTEEPRLADFFDLQQFDFGMLEFKERTVSSRSDIVVELDEETLLDLLYVPAPTPLAEANASPGTANPAPRANKDGIIVEGEAERERELEKPPLQALRSMFLKRRVVVRGKPRLTPVFVGARRDMKNKQVTLVLDNADDIVLLPRFDDDGEPILDGPLAGLGADTPPVTQ